jgi:hypothetical protein
MNIKFAPRRSGDWNEALKLVQARFKQSFAAEVMPDPDYFAILSGPMYPHDLEDQVMACMGVTLATDKRFFAEQYLDQPIETVIGQREGRSVARAEIVELGSIVSTVPMSGWALLEASPMLLLCLGARYVLSTATQELQSVFQRAGLPFQKLAQASQEKLDPGGQANWGSYYEHQPEAGFFSLATSGEALLATVGKYRMVDINMRVLKPTTPEGGR